MHPESVGFEESVTWTVKLKVAATVGVPAIKPLEELMVRPSGKAPEVIDQT